MINLDSHTKWTIGIIAVVLFLIAGSVTFFNYYDIVSKRIGISADWSPSSSPSYTGPTTSGVLNPGPSTSPSYMPSPSFTPSPGATSFDNNIDFKGKFAYTKYVNGSTYLVWNYNNTDKTVAKLDNHDYTTNIASTDLSSLLRVYYDDASKKYNIAVYHNGNIDKPFISFSTEKYNYSPIFSSEGTKIAYVLTDSSTTNKNELWTIDYNDGQRVLIADSDRINSLLDDNNIAVDAKRFRYIIPMAWSKDGNKIYLEVLVNGSFEILVYYDLSEGRIVKTALDQKNIDQLTVSPDGKKIAYVSYNANDQTSEGSSNYNFNIYNLVSDSMSQIISDYSFLSYNFTWSESSDKIVYTESQNSKYNIAYIDINTKKINYAVKDLDRYTSILSMTKNNKIIYTQNLDDSYPNQSLNVVNSDGSDKKELDSSWSSVIGIGFVGK